MTDGFEFGLDMVADTARNPAFAPAEIERERQQVLSGFQVSYDDPEYLSGVVLSRLIYGSHPYGQPSSGTPESVRRIARDDLVDFHAAHYAPNNAVLAIVGDVDAESAFAAAERTFGDWAPRTEAAAPPVGEIPEPTRRIVVIDKPGSLQTAIRVGHAALPRASPDHLPFDFAIKILGGEGGEPPRQRAEDGTVPHLLGLGRDRQPPLRRRLHREDRHPDRGDGRGVAADGRRGGPPAAGAGEPARARETPRPTWPGTSR